MFSGRSVYFRIIDGGLVLTRFIRIPPFRRPIGRAVVLAFAAGRLYHARWVLHRVERVDGRLDMLVFRLDGRSIRDLDCAVDECERFSEV